MPAFVQSYSQSQARVMFVTTLGMDNFDCTKMNAHFKKFTAMGGARSQMEACIASPTSPPYVGKPSLGHGHLLGLAYNHKTWAYPTNTVLATVAFLLPSTRSSGTQSPTRLGIRPQDLGLPNKYSLGRCGLSAASTHKLAFTSRH